MKKKLIGLIMVTTLVASLVACGKKAENPTTDNNKTEGTQEVHRLLIQQKQRMLH